MTSNPQFNSRTSGAEVVAAFPQSVSGKTFTPTSKTNSLTTLPVVITGPTPGGLGAQTALFLASAKPASILLLGRSESKALPTVQEVQAASPSTKIQFVQCDLGSYSSIRAAAQTVLSIAPKIHVLINNAGVMAPAEYRTTAEGVEVQFGSNHIGHFLLTNLLLPGLEAAAAEGGARVVNLSSNGWGLGEVRFNDYNFNNGKDWEKWAAYGQSKAANILFARGLAKKLKAKGIQAFSLHPGGINTNLARDVDFAAEMGNVIKMFNDRGYVKVDTFDFKDHAQGTSTTLVAALDPALKDHSGVFLADCQIQETAEYTTKPEYVEKLWELSENIVGEKFSI
ncbi:Short-chain dehydrogenase protein [Rutstroemia sp. NJR-2017a BBW]|nr:Short-chain dehydrogenase protein [Rutstroemia sp. NJR-2017a BBW]